MCFIVRADATKQGIMLMSDNEGFVDIMLNLTGIILFTRISTYTHAHTHKHTQKDTHTERERERERVQLPQ